METKTRRKGERCIEGRREIGVMMRERDEKLLKGERERAPRATQGRL